MDDRSHAGRLTFLGTPSPTTKQFLGTIQQTAAFDIQYEPSISGFLSAPVPKNRVNTVVLEQTTDSKEQLDALRSSGRRLVIIWIGRNFSKAELQLALDHRVHTVLENPVMGDGHVLNQLKAAVNRAEASERAEDLIFSIKTVLLQLGDTGGPLIAELKTGLLKFERGAMKSEFIGGTTNTSGETRLPFYKAQGFSDALLTVQDLERTGTLHIKGKQGGLQGRVDFLQGRPVSASCGEARALKAIYRMFLWEEPNFTFAHRDANETAMEDHFTTSLRDMCNEGETLYRRFEKIKNQLPPAQLRLQLEPSALHTSTQLDRSQFSTLSSVVELGKVSQILDYNPLPDVVLYECLIGLKKNGVIKVQAAA